MSKSGSKRSTSTGRDTNVIASIPIRPIVLPRLLLPAPEPVADLRRWTPRPIIPAAMRPDARRLKPTVPSHPGAIPRGVRFAVPPQVMICIRRKVRREVLFASGKGGSFHRPRRFNQYSRVSCK